jgi:hypothetical protein
MPSSYHRFCDHYNLDPATQDARDQFAEYCKQFDLLTGMTAGQPETRGRKPKLASGAMSQAERKAAERARRRARGEVQIWVTPEELEAIEKLRAGTNGEPTA